MSRVFCIEVARLSNAFYFRSRPSRHFFNDTYRSFTSHKRPYRKTRVSFCEHPPALTGRPVFQLSDRYDVYKDGPYLIFRIFAERDIAGHCYTLKVDEKRNRSWLSIPRMKKGEERVVFDYPLDQLFFIHLFCRTSRLIQHGCGIDHNGKAYVFLGNSGAGKTTLSRILNRNGFTVLSDDRIILHQDKKALTAYGSPWPGDGKFALPQGRPLQRIFFLCHGRKNRLVRIPPHRAAAELLRFSFIPFWDKKATRLCVDLCASVAQEIACHRLEFVPDDSVAGFLKQHM